jgi:hypothetical protein
MAGRNLSAMLGLVAVPVAHHYWGNGLWAVLVATSPGFHLPYGPNDFVWYDVCPTSLVFGIGLLCWKCVPSLRQAAMAYMGAVLGVAALLGVLVWVWRQLEPNPQIDRPRIECAVTSPDGKYIATQDRIVFETTADGPKPYDVLVSIRRAGRPFSPIDEVVFRDANCYKPVSIKWTGPRAATVYVDDTSPLDGERGIEYAHVYDGVSISVVGPHD